MRADADRVLVLESVAQLLPQRAGPFTLVPVQRWEALEDAAAAVPHALVVIDAALTTERELRTLLRRNPLLSVVAALRLDLGSAGQAAALLRAGASDLLDAELEAGPPALALRLASARARPLKRRVEALLGPRAPVEACTLAWGACEAIARGGGANELARRCALDRPTLTRCCRRLGLPASGRLCAWLRRLSDALLADAASASPRTSPVVAAAFAAELRRLREARRCHGRARSDRATFNSRSG